ncbi:MAG: radical SAM protein [Steroidobacteraceae bacterium]
MTFSDTLNIRRQGLTILTTEGCNFACRYCHQPHDPVVMSPEVVASIVRFVERKAPSIGHLDISWFGGEPLANRKAVNKLSAEFCRICRENNISLTGFMSTNGYLLTRELLADLLRLGISRYQITFDGPRSVHDRYRVLQNGGETFSRLWRNVLSFRDLPDRFEILIRVHVTPDTISEVGSFLGELRGEFASDTRFEITVTDVNHWGGPNDASIPVFDDPGPTLKLLNEMIDPTNRSKPENVYCNAADPTHPPPPATSPG